jgi:transcriptional regulator with PAS, ATPase and Fis domain
MQETNPKLKASAGIQTLQALDESKTLLTVFSGVSVIGLAVCDDKLRFEGINDALAAMNGITATSHLGNTVRDILRDAAAEPESVLRRVLANGKPESFELAAILPTRTELGYWIENYFPIVGLGKKATQVATITVEITAQRKLDKSFRQLTSRLLWTGNREHRSLARDLHDSIDEYHTALAATLRRLTASLASLYGGSWEPHKSTGVLAQSVASLDQRIVNMRTIVSEIASRFPDRSTTPSYIM